jgi:hypothetical protein
MPLYRLAPERLAPIAPVSFSAARLTERSDLQRLLRDQVEILDQTLLVIAEEFSQWDESTRRIDLLAVDRDAKLVVIELKITEDAGHADLQALRYAAMVSTMTFDQAAEAFAGYLSERGRPLDARQALLDHLRWGDPEGGRFAADVRLILVAPGFSKELTTTVLWLRDRGVDIRCIRVQPHRLEDGSADGVLLADVEQLIPLREAEEFQVRVSRKAQEERSSARERPSLDEMMSRIREGCSPAERDAISSIVEHLTGLGARWFANVGSIAHEMPSRFGPHYFFNIRPGRQIEITFKYLASRRPFDDEALRRELLDRVNAATGAHIDLDRVGKMPKIPLSAVAGPDALRRFCEVWTWASERLRDYELSSHP